MTGAALREQILEKYGDVATLEARASDDAEAADDLVQIRLFDREPHRLRHEYTITTAYRLQAREILLTEPRLRMMRAVSRAAQAHQVLGVRDLAERLNREMRNVSQDVRKLERLGLLRTRRDGREKLVLPGGKGP